jgi:hypothetical protein
MKNKKVELCKLISTATDNKIENILSKNCLVHISQHFTQKRVYLNAYYY